MDTQPAVQTKFKFFNPKIIFLILAVILLIEVVFAFRTLSEPSAIKVNNGVQITSPTMSVTSIKREYNVGDIVPVSILVDTAGKDAVGTDAILRFDPQVLEATAAAITKGTMYQDYPAVGIDAKSGIITISGISSNNTSFSGIDILASINFKAKAAASTTLSLEFVPDSTTDTNIVDITSGEDILEMVNNLSLQIK